MGSSAACAAVCGWHASRLVTWTNKDAVLEGAQQGTAGSAGQPVPRNRSGASMTGGREMWHPKWLAHSRFREVS